MDRNGLSFTIEGDYNDYQIQQLIAERIFALQGNQNELFKLRNVRKVGPRKWLVNLLILRPGRAGRDQAEQREQREQRGSQRQDGPRQSEQRGGRQQPGPQGENRAASASSSPPSPSPAPPRPTPLDAAPPLASAEAAPAGQLAPLPDPLDEQPPASDASDALEDATVIVPAELDLAPSPGPYREELGALDVEGANRLPGLPAAPPREASGTVAPVPLTHEPTLPEAKASAEPGRPVRRAPAVYDLPAVAAHEAPAEQPPQPLPAPAVDDQPALSPASQVPGDPLAPASSVVAEQLSGRQTATSDAAPPPVGTQPASAASDEPGDEPGGSDANAYEETPPAQPAASAFVNDMPSHQDDLAARDALAHEPRQTGMLAGEEISARDIGLPADAEGAAAIASDAAPGALPNDADGASPVETAAASDHLSDDSALLGISSDETAPVDSLRRPTATGEAPPPVDAPPFPSEGPQPSADPLGLYEGD